MAKEYTEDELHNLSEEDLEVAYLAAKEEDSSDEGDNDDSTNTEEENVEAIENENESDEDKIGEDLEQPGEDSDDDTSSDDEDEDESNEDSEDEDGEPDEELDAEKEKPEEDKDESEVDEQPIQRQKFKANGREYEFTDEEMRTQFPKIFGQAMDYTRKMQALKPHRKTVDAIEQAKLTHDDVNLMIDVLKGDKDAISEVMRRTGVDAIDLEAEDSSYVAKDYGRDDTALAIKDVIDDISADREYVTTENILSKQWDDSSWDRVSKDPELIRLLHVDVKSGMYDKVQPIAEKLKVYGRGAKSDLEYYEEAAGVYFQEEAQEKARLDALETAKVEAETKAADKARLEQVRKKQKTQVTVKETAKGRKAAAPSKKTAGTKTSTDFLDDSDEAFEDWYKKLQDA
jgi:hypothetical protein